MLAGVLVPLALIAAVTACRRDHRSFRLAAWFIAGWLLIYLMLSIVAWNR